MSEELHSKLVAFLANALARTEHDTVTRLELTYSPQGGYRPDPLRTWRRDSEGDKMFFVDDDGKPNHVYTQQLASEMFELATNHADSYGQGRHRFVVRAYKHLNGYLAHSFAILPSFDSDDQALATSGGSPDLQPTSTGIVAQLMRHLETRDRNAKEMMQSFINGMSHQAAQQREEIESLRNQLAAQVKERMDWLDTIEQARSQDHQRQIEALTATSREERKSHAAKKIINLLPVALSHWMGSGKSKKKKDGAANGTPSKPPSPLAQLVHKLFDSLDEDQRGQIAAALQMEQQILLVEISDVVENGDSVLLPTMLHDLVSSLLPAQIQALMSLMNAEQRVMFVQAMKLAQAQATAADDKAKPEANPAEPNGTKTTETEVS